MTTFEPTFQPAPRGLRLLLAAYAVASLAHFAHNAQYIAFYPGMPRWLTSENVVVAWLAVAAVGAAGCAAWQMGWRRVGLLLTAAFGALGLDGLLHYTLALCSEHTAMANLTIASEATLGLALLLAASIGFVRRCRVPATTAV